MWRPKRLDLAGEVTVIVSSPADLAGDVTISVTSSADPGVYHPRPTLLEMSPSVCRLLADLAGDVTIGVASPADLAGVVTTVVESSAD